MTPMPLTVILWNVNSHIAPKDGVTYGDKWINDYEMLSVM